MLILVDHEKGFITSGGGGGGGGGRGGGGEGGGGKKIKCISGLGLRGPIFILRSAANPD